MAEKYDLVLVGTGFASTFFLKKFLEKSSDKVKVLVLERGMFFPHSERVSKARGENANFKDDQEGGSKLFKNINSEKSWRFEANFGGSSNCWWGNTPRFMPNDFKLKTLYGVGNDWPFTYEELESYYTETEEIMAIAGPDVTPYPMSKKYPLPPHQLSSVDKLLSARYGPTYVSAPTARASASTKTRGLCCSSYTCNLCPVNAKFTIENTLRNIYSDSRVTLFYNAKVSHLEFENDKVKSVQYYQEEQLKEAVGEVVGLGANAIFNAHILLNSGDTNKNVGKGISEQIGKYVYFYFKDLDNLGGSSAITGNGFMFYDGAFRKEYAGCLIENHNAPIIRSEFGKWRHIARFKFVYEDLPLDENRVNLSEDKLVPVVDYKNHSPYAQKGIDALKSNIEKYFSFLPIESFEVDDVVQKTEAHILSTAKMSANAETGVVDRELIHHQYRNLFVLGGSSFPSISPANPTLTLSALSLRAADKSF